MDVLNPQPLTLNPKPSTRKRGDQWLLAVINGRSREGDESIGTGTGTG
eukprot:CAMPEP_0114569838 /NCGR_PEP_ID=MMETSP0114-20121206/16856_1 /TAXON_ID=31324 /ORGANISM="Goniomonas sp, Strain m" /LENGTH=47 /DNA_ID= /DNA_START= /DNA_END= /DNA_ORIENTATION=